MFGNFHRYWTDWEAKLKVPIEKAGAELVFPALNEVGQENGLVKFAPLKPICIYKAPQKSASSKRVGHQQIIIITGDFTLQKVNQPPYLVNASCSISFFDMEIDENGCHKLEERDAMHFDIESDDPPRAFHPVFHVQRDRSNTLSEDDIRELVAEASRSKKGMIEVDRGGMRGIQHLRVPTPQIDIFSVLTMVIADFFCKDGNSDVRVKQNFVNVLKQLSHVNNFARHGIIAENLKARSAATYFSPEFWYPEFHGQSQRGRSP